MLLKCGLARWGANAWRALSVRAFKKDCSFKKAQPDLNAALCWLHDRENYSANEHNRSRAISFGEFEMNKNCDKSLRAVLMARAELLRHSLSIAPRRT